jgi:hypothetical protein
MRTVRVFDCPRCGQGDWYLRAARPLADGTLVCRWCFTDDDAHDLVRCPGCGHMRPASEFERDPDPVWDQIAAALGGRAPHKECLACRAPQDRSRPCERCGEPFTPTRSDARFCSGRCRVAAHRQREKA